MIVNTGVLLDSLLSMQICRFWNSPPSVLVEHAFIPLSQPTKSEDRLGYFSVSSLQILVGAV